MQMEAAPRARAKYPLNYPAQYAQEMKRFVDADGSRSTCKGKVSPGLSSLTHPENETIC
jgi:hypothetical protein